MTRSVSLWMSMVCTVLVGAAAEGAAPPLASQVVKDPQNRFAIAVPADWSVQTSTGARSPAVTAKAPAVQGQLPDSVDVIAQDLPTAISPQGCAGEAAQVMRFTIHQWTTLNEGPAMLAGLPAYSRSYTWRASVGQVRRSIQTCVTMGRRAFVVVGTTANTQGSIQQDLPRLQRIMGTFRPNTTNLPDTHGPATPRPQDGGSR